MNAHKGALDGLTILDVSQMLAGPMAGMRLGDLGADVIKIEPPRGEFNRSHGYGGVDLNGHTTTFLALNRNKRSVTLDLKTAEGRQVFLDLAATADVVVQNFRIGTVQRLGVDFESLRKINPRIVYCSISGYGADGPGAGRPGQDLVMQGYSGSMWFVGSQDDPPQPGGVPAIDAMTGYQAVIGILAALRARDASGEGQHVEVDMLSVILDAQVQEFVTYLNSGLLPQRGAEESAHAWIPAPYGVHRTKDGWLTMAMCAPSALGAALDDAWIADLTYDEALEHADEIYRRVRAAIPQRTTDEWIAHFDTFNIWTGPVHDFAAVEKDAQVRARELITEIPHPEAGIVRTIASPIRMSASDAGPFRSPPLLGQHTAEILRDRLGYSPEQIASLTEAGALGAAPKDGADRG